VRKIALLCLLASALGAFIFATYQARQYPWDEYEYHRTDEVVEYLDRQSGYRWERVPIVTYERPAWVNAMRSDLGGIGFIALIIGVTMVAESVIHEKRRRR